MAYNVIIHLPNADPIVAEMDALPEANATLILCKDPRQRDGKPIHYLTPEATAIIFPLSQITFIEIVPGEMDREELLEFYRE